MPQAVEPLDVPNLGVLSLEDLQVWYPQIFHANLALKKSCSIKISWIPQYSEQ